MTMNPTKLKTAEEWMLMFGRTVADNPLDKMDLSENVLPPVVFHVSVLSEADIQQIQANTLRWAADLGIGDGLVAQATLIQAATKLEKGEDVE